MEQCCFVNRILPRVKPIPLNGGARWGEMGCREIYPYVRSRGQVSVGTQKTHVNHFVLHSMDT